MKNDPDTKPPLESLPYAPAAPGPTRRQFRMLLILTTINTIFLGFYVLGPGLQSFVKEQWATYQQRRAEAQKLKQSEAARLAKLPPLMAAQEECMKYEAPHGSLVYAEDREGGARIAPQPSYAATPVFLPAKAPLPDCFTKLPRIIPTYGELVNSRHVVLFLHERRVSPDAPARLVVVLMSPRSNIASTTQPQFEHQALVALTLRPATARDDLTVEAYASYEVARETDPFKPKWLRVGSGERDAENPSRLMIPYEITGVGNGRIYGQMNDQGLISLATTGPLRLIPNSHHP